MPKLTLLPKAGLLVLTLFFTVSTPLQAAATPSDAYGVGFGAEELEPQTPRALELASQALIDWVRLGLYWQDVEPNPGQFDFQADDALIASTRANRLNVLAILAYSTPWNTTAPADPPDNPTHYPPRDYGDWANYLISGHTSKAPARGYRGGDGRSTGTRARLLRPIFLKAPLSEDSTRVTFWNIRSRLAHAHTHRRHEHGAHRGGRAYRGLQPNGFGPVRCRSRTESVHRSVRRQRYCCARHGHQPGDEDDSHSNRSARTGHHPRQQM